MSKEMTSEELLALAGTTAEEYWALSHERNYHKIVARIDDDGNIDDAYIDETAERYDFRFPEDPWITVYCVGTGSAPCNCDECLDGHKPDLADHGEEIAAMLDDIQDAIDEL